MGEFPDLPDKSGVADKATNEITSLRNRVADLTASLDHAHNTIRHQTHAMRAQQDVIDELREHRDRLQERVWELEAR